MDNVTYTINSPQGQVAKEIQYSELDIDQLTTNSIVVINGIQTPLITTAVGTSLDIKSSTNIINVGVPTSSGVLVCGSLVSNQIIASDSPFPVICDLGFINAKGGQTYAGAPALTYNFTPARWNGTLTWAIGTLTILSGASVIVIATIPGFINTANTFFQIESTELATSQLAIISSGNTTTAFTFRIINNSVSNYTNAQLFNIHYTCC